MSGIQPPIHRLPYPWPPPEPEPEPGDLGQYVNWLTYSHRQLFDMVNEGLDLETTTEVAAGWSRLGAELIDIGTDLRQALETAAEGWQGAAADEARQKVHRLAAWTEETADGSTEVAGCVSEQAALASAARRDMPVPPPVFLPAEGGMSTDDRQGGGFSRGPLLIADPEPDRQQARELHQRAAEVMERYQHEAHALYARVPAFASPNPEVGIEHHPDGDPGERPDGPREHVRPDESTSASAADAGPRPGAGVAAPGAAGPAGGMPLGPHSGGEQYAPSSRAGTAGPQNAQVPGPAAGPGGPRPMAGPAAMPMGAGMAGARQAEDDVEHKAPSYLEEDDDLWGPQVPVAPPVLGEHHPDRRGGH
ncbi:PPE domain-containing protein [Prauserella muralis]|uniref:PPE domain-containing protein n=1 Tax=Prauserella muralis TaxID=588067 RepID=A0A2V4B964_9PSEU|nr:PPE domain-containing protein [Prauserella muralis]PXY31904.1 hypothetical protein BAY60_06125 [Prauserella muralis]TWE13678.1 PPE family protein [Prauserella muralis]